MKNHVFFLLMICLHQLHAQNRYPIRDIPADLLKNADVVVREYSLTFDVKNEGEAVETEHKVVTLLNNAAADQNDREIPYDEFRKIDDIEGVVYDAAGNVVRKLRKKDIADIKPPEYFVDDYREKVLKFPRIAFPYTIEYTIVTRCKGLMFYPVFQPQSAETESVEHARLEISMPDDLQARYLELNIEPASKTGPLAWEFRNLKAFHKEPFMPSVHHFLPLVLTAPTRFSLEGFEGDMGSWNSFGKFIASLNAGNDALPEPTITKLRQLTADCKDDACRVQRIYQYLQENTRYYLIALGIGGWQPAPAARVDELKFGDCKGLSNYTVSMLHAVGVQAYYTLIRAGDDEMDGQFPNFPNPSFNHIIACVPNNGDTLWLECTSQSESCGFLSDFTDNRPALLITPDGGKLVHTPRYDEHDNSVLRTTSLTLQTDGSALIESSDSYRGIAQDYLAYLEGQHDEARKKFLYNTLSLSDFEILQLDLQRIKNRIPEVKRKLRLQAPRFASLSGKRLFVPVIALAQKVEIPVADSTRQFPVQAQSRGFTVEDELTITIPEGYALENAVEPQTFNSVFGSYELDIRNEPGGRLLVHRKLVMNDSVQPKERFAELMQFLRNVAKADKTKLVLAKGT